MMANLLELSASHMAQAIRNKEISALEVVQAHLERISLVNPLLNAVVQMEAEVALQEAHRADQLLAQGELLGPLHGVPFTVKDAFETAGLPSTAGTMGRASYIPDSNAPAVERLRRAGAILLGKTNVPELSLLYECDNLIYGRTNNPYDLARTPGGSCGGEAAIIAAGGSPLGLGSDAAGSIRVPAHFCGIAGVKPTLGRIPTTGHFPPAAGTLDHLLSVGLLSRSVEDLILALPLLIGPDQRDPEVVPLPFGELEHYPLSNMRAVFFTDNGIHPPTPETAAAVKRCASLLQQAGMQVEEAVPDGIELTMHIINGILYADGGESLRSLLQMAGTETPYSLTHRLLKIMSSHTLSTAELSGINASWYLLRSMMLSFMQPYDVLLCPTAAFPAPPHGSTMEEEMMTGFSYSMTFNLTGWPAVVVPVGISPEGLPIGVQVAAPPWKDEVALAVARFLEQECQGALRPLL